MDAKAIARLISSYAPLRGDALERELAAHSAADPRCAVTRYLLATHCFERGRPAMGVRNMMIAYHAEPDLQSAALLAFAGLNWIGCPRKLLLPVLLETWEEFRRPEFDRTRKERLLFDAFCEPEPLDAMPVANAGGDDLARRLWRLPIRMLRAQIREAVRTRNAELCPILLSPA